MAIVPKGDEFIIVGKQWRSGTREHEPREFVTGGTGKGKMTTKRKAPFALEPISGGQIQRRRPLKSGAFVKSRGSVSKFRQDEPQLQHGISFRKKAEVRRNGDVYRAIRRSTSGTCAASTKNVAPSRNASRRAHCPASSWYRSGHIPSRYICHLRDQSALHSSGSTSTIVRIMSPSSSAPQPPLPRRATQGGPVSPRRAQKTTEVGSTSA
jgi:hypothetical protein